MLHLVNRIHLVGSALLLALLGSPVEPHGGQYKGPADAGGGQGAGGSTVGPPTNAGGSQRPGPGASSSSTGSGSGARTGGDRNVRGGSGRGGTHTGAGLDLDGAELETWESWWEHNKDVFLGLRQRLDREQLTASGPGALAGKGRNIGRGVSRRPDRTVIEQQLIPTLLALVAASDEADVLDSGILALARVAQEGQAAVVVAAALPLLAHRDLPVQSTAALALGVLGSDAAAASLRDVLADNSAGRRLTGGGPVPWLVRSFAALALGFLGDDPSVSALMDCVARLRGSERDVRICALVALGLLGPEHPRAEEVAGFLVRQLQDRSLDPLVASFIPTALGKLGRREALAAVDAAFVDRDGDARVVQSAAIALGRLASLDDQAVVEHLADCIAGGKDAQARHFALIALGQIGARTAQHDALSAEHGALAALLDAHVAQHDALAALLTRELLGRGKSRAHRSWAALAAALYCREVEERQPEFLEKLRSAYAKEHDPSFKGAYAVALGLLADRASAAMVFSDFNTIAEPGFRGYAGVALGFLDHREATPALRGLCQSQATPPTLRLHAATGLGLLRDSQAVPTLIATLERAETLGVSSAAAKALGLIGDRDALDPLTAVATDETRSLLTRAFACVALGLLGEKTDLPWSAAISADNNYRATTPSLQEILDIL